MAKGKHEAPSPARARRRSSRSGMRLRSPLPLIAALVLILGAAVGGTMAYFTDRAQMDVSTYEAGVVSCAIDSGCVVNTGNVDAYVRVTLVQNYRDENGSVCPNHEVIQPQALGDWVALDSFSLCYSKALAPGERSAPIPGAAELSSGSVADDNCVSQLILTTSAIQAQPVNAVSDAWGYTPGA